MNRVSTGCGDNVEDTTPTNTTDRSTATTTGWFWISEPTSNTRMTTSQSASSLQLFAIKPAGSKVEKAAECQKDVVVGTEDGREDPKDPPAERRAMPRKSVSLCDLGSVDKGSMVDEEGLARGPKTDEIVSEGRHREGTYGVGDAGGTGNNGVGCVAPASEEHAPEARQDKNEVGQDAEMRRRQAEKAGISRGVIHFPPYGASSRNQSEAEEQKIMEEKLKKSQRTIRTLYKANTGFQDEISNLTATLDDEFKIRRVLQEELEASRKLCCEMYHNVLAERANAKRRSTDSFVVERHLSPEKLEFSVSDAAVQTDLLKPRTQNSPQNQNVAGDYLCLANAMVPTRGSTNVPGTTTTARSHFHLSHVLEEFQENQRNLEAQLKTLSTQCREKDESLREVKEKLGGHIRLNAMLQSEKVCLELTVSHLREEITSCDHLVATCESVLKEKDAEIRGLQEAKFELERRIAEFEFKENELKQMTSSFHDDIRDLAMQRKKLRKCVKKSSGVQRQKQVKEVKVEKARSERKELETKAQLLEAIREIAFKHPNPLSQRPSQPTANRRTEVLKQRHRRQITTGLTTGRQKSYTVCSVEKSVLVSGETPVLLRKTSTHSVNQETPSSGAGSDTADCPKATKYKDAHRVRRNNNAASSAPGRSAKRYQDCVGNQEEFVGDRISKKGAKIKSPEYFTEEEDVEYPGDDKTRQHGDLHESLKDLRNHDQESFTPHGAQEAECPDGSPVVDGIDVDAGDCEVTSSCQRLYGDVVNELTCKHAALAITASTSSLSLDDDSQWTGTTMSDNLLSDEYPWSDNSDDSTAAQNVEKRAVIKGTPTKKGANNTREIKEKDTNQLFSSNNSNDSKYDENVQISQDKELDQETSLQSPSKEFSKDTVFSEPGQGRKMSDLHVPENDQRMGLCEDDLEFCMAEEEEEEEEDDEEEEDELLYAEYGHVHVEADEVLLEDNPRSAPVMENSYRRDEKLMPSDSEDDYVQPRPDSFGCEQHLGRSAHWSIGQRNREEDAEDAMYASSENGSSARLHSHTSVSPSQGRHTSAQLPEETHSGRKRHKAQSQTQHSNPAANRNPPDNGHLYSATDNGQVSQGALRRSGHQGALSAAFHPDFNEVGHWRERAPTNDLRLGEAVLDLEPSDSDRSQAESLEDVGRAITPKESEAAEGLILCKKVMENYATRANDRSWNFVYLVQLGSRLLLYREKLGQELGEQPSESASLTSAIVAVARDYTKRKHVFRVQLTSGQLYLFSARDDREMMYWVCRLDAAAAHHPQAGGRGYGYTSAAGPASITTVPPDMSGSPTRSQRFKNFIRGGISALRI